MCDMCGKYFKRPNPKQSYLYLHIIDAALKDYVRVEPGIELDICEECRKKVLSFINEERERHNLCRILNN